MELPELFTEQEAARFLKVSVSKLQHDRWFGGTIPYIKLGRIVRYSKQALLTYCEQHTRISSNSK